MSEDTPWLSPAQLYNWVHLSAALTALPTAIEQQLKQDTGLNYYEYSVLAALSEAPGRAMKMSTLASSALGSPSRLSHAVTRLERAGWAERRNCSTGPRTVEAVLTDAGYAKVTEAAPGHVRLVRQLVVDTLSEEEFDQLQHGLRKILQATSPATLEQLDQLFAGDAAAPTAHEACRALAGMAHTEETPHPAPATPETVEAPEPPPEPPEIPETPAAQPGRPRRLEHPDPSDQGDHTECLEAS